MGTRPRKSSGRLMTGKFRITAKAESDEEAARLRDAISKVESEEASPQEAEATDQD